MLEADSRDYQLIVDGVHRIRNVEGLSCEIGLRAGGGSAYIMSALRETGQFGRTHIAIDPYGNIEYETAEHNVTRHDYTNQMRDKCMVGMYNLSQQLCLNFLFFNMEDTEFFNRYADGVPIYKERKSIETKYAFVHFDGPHAYAPVLEEFKFFDPRADKGAVFVFDDVSNYNHDKLEREVIFAKGWSLIHKTNVKASYIKG